MPRIVPIILTALVLAATPAVRAGAGFDGLSQEGQLQQAVDFVIGNAIFDLYHEAARMLIADFGLPAPGPQLETADQLAAAIMLEANEEWLDTAIVNATDSWYLAREAADALPPHNAPLHSVLVPPRGRDRQMACLMVGKDAEGYGDLAVIMGLPKAEWDACVASYPATVSRWAALLAPHARQTTGQTHKAQKSRFAIAYEPAPDPQLQLFATMIRESQVLDLIGRSFSGYALQGGVRLVARSCGRPDAYWSKERREITYCYELAKFRGDLIATYLAASDKTRKPAGDPPTAINLGQEL